MALGFEGYLAALVPGLPKRVVAVGVVVALTVVNLLGVKKAGLLNTLIVFITLGTLIAFVIAAVPRSTPAT